MTPCARPFGLALRFLTRLPLPAAEPAQPPELGGAILYFPLVGALLGGLLAGVYALLGPGPLAAALVVSLWAVLSGGLHLDGLADTADAWVGGQGDRQRTLAIMKDPAAGPMGVSAVVLALLLKFAALAEGVAGVGLLLVPLLGRAALLALFLTTPYVRPGGLGSVFARHLPGERGWLVLGLSLLVVPLLLGGHGVLLLVALAPAAALFRRALLRRIGGTTGDTAGAAVELTEAFALVLLAL